MDYTITFDNTHKYFLIETAGDLDYEAFQELAKCLLTDANWSPDCNCLFDYRKTDFLKADKTILQQIGTLHQKNNSLIGRGKSAFVMQCTGNFGMARMYQGNLEPHVETEFHVFTDFDKARSWIITDEQQL